MHEWLETEPAPSPTREPTRGMGALAEPQFVKTLPILTACPVNGRTWTARNRFEMHVPMGVPA